MRAARERVRPKPTQEQVAERMNVSIHTFRRWDQGRNRPSSPEQMQLLAAVLGTSIDVIWPATDDPLVAEALRLEQQRRTVLGPARSQGSTGSPVPDSSGDGEIRVRRLEKSSIALGGPPEHLDLEAGDRETEASMSAFEGRSRPASERDERDATIGETQGAAGELPPWPDEDPTEEALSELRPTPLDSEVLERTDPGALAQRSSSAIESADDRRGALTLPALRPLVSRRAKRTIVAVGAAVAIGGAGMIAASAPGERAADADRPTQAAAEQTSQREHARAAARAREVAAMREAADRGDYDAAIARARQLDDAAAASGYREAAARVLVGRADMAARRGDLSLARSRLEAAKRRYGTAPGSSAVETRVRRIERQRKERAERQRAARRAAAALEAQRQAEASEARASEPPAATTSVPSTSSAPQSSSSQSSPSSSSTGSGGGGGRKKEREEAVDPGLF